MNRLFCGLGLNSQATQLNLGKRSHEKSSANTGALVQHGFPLLCGCSSSRTGEDQHQLLRAQRTRPEESALPFHLSQSLQSSVGGGRGSQVPSLFSYIPQSAGSVLSRPGRADQ